jgi:hypothetical protein
VSSEAFLAVELGTSFCELSRAPSFGRRASRRYNLYNLRGRFLCRTDLTWS